jgi:5-formyltetrahydrofolate cyclo-ligase
MLSQHLLESSLFQEAQCVLGFYPMQDEPSLAHAWVHRPRGQRWFFPQTVPISLQPSEEPHSEARWNMHFWEKPPSDVSFLVQNTVASHPLWQGLKEPCPDATQVPFESMLASSQQSLGNLLVCVPGLLFASFVETLSQVSPHASPQAATYLRLGRGKGYYDQYLAMLKATWHHTQNGTLTCLGVTPDACFISQAPCLETSEAYFLLKSLHQQHMPWDMPLEGVVTEKRLYTS